MRLIVAKWLLAALALAGYAGLALAEKDTEGSKDHPSISRFPGFYIDDYKFNDFDAMGVGPFSPNHILGTDFDGVDLLAAIAHGARWSILISFISVFSFCTWSRALTRSKS